MERPLKTIWSRMPYLAFDDLAVAKGIRRKQLLVDMDLLFPAIIVSATGLVNAGKDLILGEIVKGFGFDGD